MTPGKYVPITHEAAREIYRLTLDLADECETLGDPAEASHQHNRAELWRQMILDHGGPDVAALTDESESDGP